jgi:hypothetical protein
MTVDGPPLRGEGCSSVALKVWFPIPRKQGVQLMRLGAPGDDALEHVSEPCHWLDAIELGGLYEGHGVLPSDGLPRRNRRRAPLFLSSELA